jgi:tetratricopeptide (TPR) repeat protein
MRSLPLVLALLPGIAAAKPIGWGAEGAGSVEISGPVEVPLVSGPATKGNPGVWVTAKPDAEGFAAGKLAVVDLAGGWTTITEGDAATYGAKVKHGRRVLWITPHPGRKLLNSFEIDVWEKTYDYAVIPELHVGGVVLHDVRARVGSSFTLGVATFEEVGAALLPSKGVVKFVPADQAEALLAEVGTPADAVRSPAKRWKEWGQTERGTGVSFAVAGSVGGREGQVRIRTDRNASVLTSDDGTWTRKVDGVRSVATAPVVAGATVSEVWVSETGTIASIDGSVIAVLGYDALYSADIAVAPGLDKLAIKPITSPKLVDPRTPMLEYAKAKFERDEKTAAEKPEEKATVEGYDPGLPGAVGRETAYADALNKAGRLPEAVEHYRKAVAVAGDNCAPYHALGNALLATGNAAEAAPLFEKAGGLWDRWYAQDVDTRDLIAAKKNPAGATFANPQPSSCHTAWGDAAEARLAMGDHAAVADLYSKHVDLDADLPLAYGLSLLAQGKTEAANGAIRQAINMGASDDATRAALAFVNGGAVADRQVERVAFTTDLVSFGRIGVVEAARKSGGDAAALAATEELAKNDPLSVEAAVLHAYELHRQGKADELAKALAAMEPLLGTWQARWQNHPAAGTYAAVVQALKGDAAGAKSALEANQKDFGPTSGNVIAQAMVARIAGDAAAADAALATLRATRPLDARGFVGL